MARAPGPASPCGSSRARPVRRHRGEDTGRRVPRHVRRPGHRDPRRNGDPRRDRGTSTSRCASACIAARSRSWATTSAGSRCTSRRASASLADARRGAREPHREGPRRRVGHQAPIEGHPHPQGRPRRVGALRCDLTSRRALTFSGPDGSIGHSRTMDQRAKSGEQDLSLTRRRACGGASHAALRGFAEHEPDCKTANCPGAAPSVAAPTRSRRRPPGSRDR